MSAVPAPWDMAVAVVWSSLCSVLVGIAGWMATQHLVIAVILGMGWQLGMAAILNRRQLRIAARLAEGRRRQFRGAAGSARLGAAIGLWAADQASWEEAGPSDSDLLSAVEDAGFRCHSDAVFQAADLHLAGWRASSLDQDLDIVFRFLKSERDDPSQIDTLEGILRSFCWRRSGREVRCTAVLEEVELAAVRLPPGTPLERVSEILVGADACPLAVGRILDRLRRSRPDLLRRLETSPVRIIGLGPDPALVNLLRANFSTVLLAEDEKPIGLGETASVEEWVSPAPQFQYQQVSQLDTPEEP